MKKKEYKNVVIYGAGQCYRNVRDRIRTLFNVHYICDRKFAEADNNWDGLSIISKEQIPELEDCLVIICLYNQEERSEVKHEIEKMVECKGYDEVLPKPWGRIMNYEEIQHHTVNGCYSDDYDNKIYFAGEIPEKLLVRFIGVCNSVYIGEKVSSAMQLIIECGTKSNVYIGDGSTFHDTHIDASFGDIKIGNDCMFSLSVYVRNTDSHHIFNKRDGRRINYTKNIQIGDHVWVGQNAILLGGVQIDSGSIVGAGAVTSGHFPENAVIAGNPARVIRENVVWSREDTYLYDKDHYED